MGNVERFRSKGQETVSEINSINIVFYKKLLRLYRRRSFCYINYNYDFTFGLNIIAIKNPNRTDAPIPPAAAAVPPVIIPSNPCS